VRAGTHGHELPSGEPSAQHGPGEEGCDQLAGGGADDAGEGGTAERQPGGKTGITQPIQQSHQHQVDLYKRKRCGLWLTLTPFSLV